MILITNNYEQIKSSHLSQLRDNIKNQLQNKLSITTLPFQQKYYQIILKNLENILIGNKEFLDEINNGNINEIGLKFFTNFKAIINEYKKSNSGVGSREKNRKSLIQFINQNFSFFNITITKTSLEEIKKEAVNHINSILNHEELINDTLEIFSYKDFVDNDTWGRHKVISSLNIPVCPYCNRQYITNYGEKNNEKTTADLDHYYPKSKYPYLALSLYNFIPSCQICNSRMKGDKEGHLYPYNDECGDKAIFKTSNNSINGILNSKATDFEIEFDIQEHKITQKEKDNGYLQRLEKSKEIFKLEEVYKTSHNQYILDMLHTIEHYPDSYLETVNELFDENLTKTIKKKEEELEKVTVQEEKDKIENELNKLKNRKTQEKKSLKEILRKPYQDRIERNDTLAKLTKDILDEYDSL